MIKYIFRVTACVLLLSLLLTFPNYATATTQSQNTIYFEDGSYVTIETFVTGTRGTSTKTASRVYTYYANNGNIDWSATLNGTFTYTGTSSTCTAASCTISISNSNWYEIGKNSSKIGSSAVADVTMGYKILGITTNRKTVNMSLTCDANGNLS